PFRPPAKMMMDDMQGIVDAVSAGAGIAWLPEWLVRNALDAGELVSLLPAYTFAQQGIYAVYPDARHVSAKVRTFIDFMRVRVT
ncbi:hypothetical protein LLE87_35290, partial [Paenibacillus polymyxa]|nr:hypothetical protein [Paenibacillus polymyxa]